MSRLIRRYGSQALLLTSAFATAVLLALAFKPAKFAQIERPSPASIQTPAPAVPVTEAEREAAQAKLAQAMARFAAPAAREPEPLAPAPVEAAPEPEPPVSMAKAVELEAPVAPAPATPLSAPRPTLRATDMRRLSDKAAQALRDGDVYGARLILEHSIEGGDVQALVTLAETYDPKVLARMNARNVKPDPTRARDLYAQALEKGVAGAKAKLEALGR